MSSEERGERRWGGMREPKGRRCVRKGRDAGERWGREEKEGGGRRGRKGGGGGGGGRLLALYLPFAPELRFPFVPFFQLTTAALLTVAADEPGKERPRQQQCRPPAQVSTRAHAPLPRQRRGALSVFDCSSDHTSRYRPLSRGTGRERVAQRICAVFGGCWSGGGGDVLAV